MSSRGSTRRFSSNACWWRRRSVAVPPFADAAREPQGTRTDRRTGAQSNHLPANIRTARPTGPAKKTRRRAHKDLPGRCERRRAWRRSARGRDRHEAPRSAQPPGRPDRRVATSANSHFDQVSASRRAALPKSRRHTRTYRVAEAQTADTRVHRPNAFAGVVARYKKRRENATRRRDQLRKSRARMARSGTIPTCSAPRNLTRADRAPR